MKDRKRFLFIISKDVLGLHGSHFVPGDVIHIHTTKLLLPDSHHTTRPELPHSTITILSNIAFRTEE
jgi:hypothetical protein